MPEKALFSKESLLRLDSQCVGGANVGFAVETAEQEIREHANVSEYLYVVIDGCWRKGRRAPPLSSPSWLAPGSGAARLRTASAVGQGH